MSHQAVCWALLQPVKPPTAKHLLTVLAHYVSATKEGPWRVFPSVSQLANDTGQDRKTVMLNLKRLLESGYIVDTGEREGATKSVPVYELQTPPSSTNIGTAKQYQSTPEAVPNEGQLSSTNSGTAMTQGSSTNPPHKQYQSTPEAVPIYPTEQVEQVLTGEEEAAAASPPRAYVGAPACEADEPPPPPDATPNRAAQISVLLRRNGADCRIAPNDRHIARWIADGVTDAQVLVALEIAKGRRAEAGSQQPIGTPYLTPIINDQRAPPGAPATYRNKSAAQRRSDWTQELNQHLARLTGDDQPENEIHDLGVIDASGNPVR